MTLLKPFLLIAIATLVLSCKEDAYIQIQNNISNVKITEVAWGDTYLAYELLPGEVSDKISVDKYSDDLPGSHAVAFTMKANGKSVFLMTDSSYQLDNGDDIFITLEDSTKSMK